MNTCLFMRDIFYIEHSHKRSNIRTIIYNIKKWLTIFLKCSDCKLCKILKYFNHFLMLCKKIKSYDINRTLKNALLKKIWFAFSATWNIRKKLKSCWRWLKVFILKMLGRINDKWMQRRRCVTRAGIFFAFLCYWLYRYRLSKHKFFVWEGQLMKILGFIFSGHQEKNL